jgi:hypothetical protein
MSAAFKRKERQGIREYTTRGISSDYTCTHIPSYDGVQYTRIKNKKVKKVASAGAWKRNIVGWPVPTAIDRRLSRDSSSHKLYRLGVVIDLTSLTTLPARLVPCI